MDTRGAAEVRENAGNPGRFRLAQAVHYPPSDAAGRRIDPDKETPVNKLVNRLRKQDGQGMTEYIIIAILIAIVVLIAVRQLGTSVKTKFEKAKTEVDGL